MLVFQYQSAVSYNKRYNAARLYFSIHCIFALTDEEEGGLSKFKRLVCCMEKPQLSDVSLTLSHYSAPKVLHD
jgi:hypothetical protein